MADVCLTDVCKIYSGGVKAVDRVSLAIHDGEFVVLVGPSGCGKSTTLRMVAGLEEISSGRVEIGGRVVNDVPPKDRDIAMVFQNYALYPYMTVYENMAFGLKLRRRKLGLSRREIDAKVNEVAATLGLTDLLKRKPGALSGGQRQRVAVGRAIVRSPRAFLFDEPLSNLDAKLRVEMRAEIKKLHRRLKTTTIYVTHDQEEAMTLGDRLVVMDGGVVQQCATPLEVYRRPTNRFVAGFVGSPPMNFIGGSLRNADGRMTFHGGTDLTVPIPDDLANAMRGYADQNVVLGVRPEALRLTAIDAPPASVAWTARALVIEPLGEMMDVQLVTGGNHPLVARIPAGHSIREGGQVSIDALAHGVHFFEPGPRGANLTRGESI